MGATEKPQIEVCLHEVIDELQPGGCASGEIEWDTVIAAMKRYATIKCKEQREICSKTRNISYLFDTKEDENYLRNEVLTAASPDI